MAAALPDQARGWLDQPIFVTVATLNRDGSPHTAVHWVARDGDDLLLSSVRGRKHADNVARDPRVSILAMAPDSGYAYVEIRGRATVTEEGGRALIDDLSEKYRGVRPYPSDKPGAVRVVIRVPPEHVVLYGRR